MSNKGITKALISLLSTGSTQEDITEKIADWDVKNQIKPTKQRL